MHPLEIFELVIAMLLAIIGLQYIAQRLRLPPAVALLTGGSALAFLPGLPAIALDPELVLVLFLPPLLMDGAWFLSLAHLRQHIAGIFSLAVGAVVFTTAAVALVAHLILPELPWAACTVIGAIVSPPDAVSARAVLQRVKLPSRVSTLLEGESLFNDATGLVLFRFAVAAAVSGTFSMADALGSFTLLAIGGAVVGMAIGALWVLIIPRLGNDYLMIAGSALTCWTAYIAAETLHVSGIIATVVTGLICGWYQHVLFSANVRLRGTSFWQVMIFLLEASVFLLIGSSLRGVIDRVGGFEVVIEQMALPVLAIVAAMTVARFGWVFLSDAALALLRRLGLTRRRPLGVKAGTVLSWAGMRGVMTLAIALTLPQNMPGRDFMLVAAFAVILVTVLVQGTTLGTLIRLMRLGDADEEAPRKTVAEAEAAMAAAQLRAVEQNAYDEDGKLIHPQLLDRYQARARISANYVGREDHYHDGLHAHFDLVLVAIAAGRAELIRLHRAREIDDDVLHDLERDLDLEELSALSAKA
ncbi:CPA1 family monovalent cation:H+ antiporter [Sphingomonas zeicaulis]|uniref:Na+/H+ antiporter n=1 Tax=Sphingomonas zeicaulis TaxID=1632740 RepID=UPI003D1DBA58